jgi:inositol polyphosphate 5-phosphatase INPP5E
VGIQEGLPEFKSWEVDLQKTIGLSHVLLASEAVGTIHISIFLRRDLIWFCTKPLISRYHLRLINSKNSKGFVGAFFCLFGSSVLFMTSHLTAGHSAESLDVRIAQLNRIYRLITYGIFP